MNQKYEALFTPWKIGNVEIKNRIVLCPMGGTSLFGWMEPNHFDKEAAKFFLERANNNVGLIIPGIAPLKDRMALVHDILKLPENVEVFSLFALGYPAESRKQQDRFDKSRIHFVE